MIDFKEAIKRAEEFISEFYNKPERMQLEAFYLSDDKKHWNVTHSFWQATEPVNQLQAALGIKTSKKYKTIQVSAETGEITGMKPGFAENPAEIV